MELQVSINLKDSGKFIRQILAIDSVVYPEELQGTFTSVSERFYRNRDSYILAMDHGLIVGYFCFFPVNLELYKRINTVNSFYDDDIKPDQIVPYGTVNNLFLISAAIHPDWQDGEAIGLLSKGFRIFLREKEKNRFHINSLNCYITSENGAKLAKRFGMKKIYTKNNLYSFYKVNRKTINNFCCK